ncbi:hypothetical protein BC833DRAFT_608993 [Globomyces pollinis-pini]|nr:hypothetical protein BC833DRAFT_608993 [Globomyces pollinis-pini]KAJ2991669.1 hypothetical protein HDV02_003643 [Globomyces sp. JEL0801]
MKILSISRPLYCQQRTLTIENIHAETVALRLKSKSEFRYLILDVREKSYYDQLHIKGAINIESQEIMKWNDLSLLTPYLKDVNQLVLHCQLSLIRSPACALKIINLTKLKKDLGPMRIGLLTGGFKRWESLYGTNTDLCEGTKLSKNGP